MNIVENFQNSPIYNQVLDYLKQKYPDEYDQFTEQQLHDHFENIVMIGLNKAKEFLHTNKSCNLLYNGKPPRADMFDTLGNILFELQSITSFPIVPPLRVSAAVKKVLSGKDKRTMDKHMNWIINMANFQNKFNSIDLTNIVRQYPDDKIVRRNFWQ